MLLDGGKRNGRTGKNWPVEIQYFSKAIPLDLMAKWPTASSTVNRGSLVVFLGAGARSRQTALPTTRLALLTQTGRGCAPGARGKFKKKVNRRGPQTVCSSNLCGAIFTAGRSLKHRCAYTPEWVRGRLLNPGRRRRRRPVTGE